MTNSAETTSPEVAVPDPESVILSAELKNSFDYTRSLGPVLSQFALALRDGRIVGSRGSDGRVSVPPTEFDPTTGAATSDIVEVAAVGTVQSWTWQPSPSPEQPLDQPFAWALIKLDGADTALLHAVSADTASELSTGARVHAVWREVRTGRIDDISHFAVGDAASQATPSDGESIADAAGNVVITTPIGMTVKHTATESESWYLEGLKAGKLIGGRVETGEVYFPPRVVSPADGSLTTERVELPDTGTITTFCIVNVPFLGQQIKPPYVAAYVLLDGADIPFLHLILDVEASEVRMGMRVKAVWRPEEEWDHTLRNVSHFAPSGEPDADFESYRNHL
ncbi:OB-fold domain-containing protein [Gordonia sp. PDNC005]|uniref:Zn-ribbon domain-containing OB-fold protein n=1 Tax=unclassified Gordonia (in: high G+C Gram-positive bacteria) TaxID=2657482 RepID=UPI0019654462|nr:OB-fold nucleic acid binding domain-containing protein [Gordonia sp. PDNC005]QRY61844.1 OB-fold domain-containing protein [Gordonia sp. PDNC005]